MCLAQRFFILRRDFPSLCYFTSEEKLELLGEIVVTEDTLVLDRSSAGHAPYRFQVRSEDKALLLEAESRDDQRRWMESCQELADALRALKFSHSSAGNSLFALHPRDRPSLESGAKHKTPTSTPPTSGGSGASDRHNVQSRPSVNRKILQDNQQQHNLNDNQLEAMAPSRHRMDSDVGELLETLSWHDDDDSDSDDSESAFLTGTTTTTTNGGFSRSLDGSADAGGNNRRMAATGTATMLGSRQLSRSQLTVSSHSGSQSSLFDLSIEVMLGSSKLSRSADQANDKIGCFVSVSGHSRRSRSQVEIGMTDSMKLSAVVAAAAAAAATSSNNSGGSCSLARVPFTVVLTCELEQFDVLHFQLHKTLLNQAPGNIQSTIGSGRCVVDDDFVMHSVARSVSLSDRSGRDLPLGSSPSSSSPADNGAVNTKYVTSPSDGRRPLTNAGSYENGTTSSTSDTKLIIQAYRSVPPQVVLPTTGIDMASSKFLIPTTLPSAGGGGRDSVKMCDFTRSSDARTFLDNDSFLNSNGDLVGGGVRFVALDEILRVPRSTYALPLAMLDHLEEQALERTRQLHKQAKARAGTVSDAARVELELSFYRTKIEEYMKQRQFLMKQEKRLLDEQHERRIFGKLARGGKLSKSAVNGKDKDAASGGDELVAPFKRSTYKSLNLWQFLPTNMQDQFLCTFVPSQHVGDGESVPFAWHTMTMGCPAAHTKGFASGGYPLNGALAATIPSPNNPALSPSEEPLLSDNGPTSPVSGNNRQQQTTTRMSGDSGSSNSAITFKQQLELSDRLNIIGSQILSAAVACLLSTLDLAALGSEYHMRQLAMAPSFGYLVNFESLLSTQGKEIGMLEDFAAGAKWLRRVFIQFRKHASSGTLFTVKPFAPPEQSLQARDKTNDGMGGFLLVTMGLSDTHLAVVPPMLKVGKPFRVRCVLFTQGVNEKQSLVHAYKSGSVKLQERINRDNLAELKQLYSLFRRLRTDEMEAERFASRTSQTTAGAVRPRSNTMGNPSTQAKSKLEALDDLLVQIEHHICSAKSQYRKNVALLMDSSDFCRELGGARVTCCKSGKDRTAMSVTLEQARICCGELRATQGTRLCATMRYFGVRRKNVFLNTKADKFAFNEVQRKMLPDCYKPPAGTYKSGKT